MPKMIVTATSGNTVNMRKLPDSTADIIARIPIGTVVESESSALGWHLIKYKDNRGYMMDKFLTSNSSLSELKIELQKILQLLDKLED